VCTLEFRYHVLALWKFSSPTSPVLGQSVQHVHSRHGVIVVLCSSGSWCINEAEIEADRTLGALKDPIT